MNRFLFRIFITLISCCFYSVKSQNIYFPHNSIVDSTNLHKGIVKVSEQLLDLYAKSDWGALIYYDNVFKNQFICELNNESISTLNILRQKMGKGDTVAIKGTGFQYEVLALTRIEEKKVKSGFSLIYLATFKKLYNNLSDNAKPTASSYFSTKLSDVKVTFNNILEKVKLKDTISYDEASLLTRAYASYLVYSQSIDIGKKALFEIENDNYLIDDSILVKTKDNTEIALLFVKKREALKPLPAILEFTIYPSSTNISNARLAADNGYVGIVAFVRGKGLSKSNITLLEYDAKDVNTVIDWISKQPWCNGKVGMRGASYSGFTQWAATKYLHPALKTIVPKVSIAPGIDFIIKNGIFKLQSLKYLNYVTNNKFTDENSDKENWYLKYYKWYVSGCAYKGFDSLLNIRSNVFQKWITHPTYDSYWARMIPCNKEFSRINIPILTITGYYDTDQLGALHYFLEHEKYNISTNHYLLIGPYNHYGAQGILSGQIDNYKTDPVSNINIIDLEYQWFNYILKDSTKPKLLKDKVNYQVMGRNIWKHASSLSKMNNDTLTFYFTPTAESKYQNLSRSKATKAYTMQNLDLSDRADSLRRLYSNYLDTVPDYFNGTIYQTPILTDNIEVNGSMFGLLKVETNKKDFDFYIRLYELDSSNTYMFLGETAYRSSLMKNKSKRQLLKPNKLEEIPFSKTNFVSKEFKKGSRIIIVLGINKMPDLQINYGTGKDVSTESIKDAGEPLQIKWYNDSYIKIPVWRPAVSKVEGDKK
jgi:uncharacterized protein